MLLAYTFGRALRPRLSSRSSSCGSSSPCGLRRNDIGVLGKVLWIVAILVIPLVGLLAYFLWDAARPRTT